MNVILGAGMAGLGAFYCDDSINIFEKDRQAGGLCGRFGIRVEGSDQVFYFDKAIHLSFTNDPIVKKAFSTIAQNIHHPIPHSWFHGTWLQHPAQNNLYPLPAEFKVQAIKDFIDRDKESEPKNFKEWLLLQYGEFLYEELFKPYNEKYWCTNLEQMSTNWVGNRFYRPSIDEVLYGSYTDKTPNTYYAKEMRYPHKGGYCGYIESIITKAENSNKIHYGYEVEKIIPSEKTVAFSNGESIQYDKLLSSVPIPELIRFIPNVPERIRKCTEGLEHSSIAVVSFGFNRVIDFDSIWFYIYDMDILAARAYLPSLKSLDNAPAGCSSIQFEIYYNSKSAIPDKEECFRNCIYALDKFGIAKEEDIIMSDFRILEYGNVIFKKDTAQNVRKVLDWLENCGINSIGRFGRWEYLWSDQAFLSGYETALKLKRKMQSAGEK